MFKILTEILAFIVALQNDQMFFIEFVTITSKGTCEKMLVACQIKVIGLDCTSSKRNLAIYTSFER